MTRKEAAIIGAYTGILVGKFEDLHSYAEKVLNRPIFTHQFADPELAEELKEKSKPDFISLVVVNE